MKINPGVGYTSVNLGEASGLVVDAGTDWLQKYSPRQFECPITGRKLHDSYEYHLHVRKGLVEFDYYTSDENGIIDINALGRSILVTTARICFSILTSLNVYPTGSLTEGNRNKH
jgi:hypothetical protein